MDSDLVETTALEIAPLPSSDKQIMASKTDVTKHYQALGRKYFPFLSQLEDVQSYRTHKSEILSSAQIKILKFALSEEKMKKASFIALCQGFEILNKAERLELGKSTENINNRHFGTLQLEAINE